MTRLLIRRDGDDWRSPEVTAYDNESALQSLLAESPNLLPGIDHEIVAAATEFPVPETGSADLVIVDDEGQISIVECKLRANPDIRRQVIGQVFAYAAGMSTLNIDQFESAFVHASEIPLLEQIGADTSSGESIRSLVAENLEAGRFRLIIAVDEITPELQRVVRYINQHTTGDVELLAIELRYIRHSDVEILVPEVYGEESAAAKSQTRSRGVWSESVLFSTLRDNLDSEVYEQAQRLREFLRSIGGRYRGSASRGVAGRFVLPVTGRDVTLVAFFCQGQVWGPDWPDYVALNMSNLSEALPFDHVRSFTDELSQHAELVPLIYSDDGSLNNWIDIPFEGVLTQPGAMETLQRALEGLVRREPENADRGIDHQT